MPAQYIPGDHALDLTDDTDYFDFEVKRFDLIRFQAKVSGSWGSAVVSIQFSLNGTDFDDLPEYGALTISADGLTKAYYLPAVGIVRIKVSTEDAGAGTATVVAVADCTRLAEVVYRTSGGVA